MNGKNSGLEEYQWTGTGYQPLVLNDGWQVALLNWEPIFDWKQAGEIERHNQTDEVFVLWRGQAVLFVSEQGRLHAEEMVPGVVYNVRCGVWHNLLATHDASWLIVEKRDTHLHDTELRQMSPKERRQLEAVLPAWAER